MRMNPRHRLGVNAQSRRVLDVARNPVSRRNSKNHVVFAKSLHSERSVYTPPEYGVGVSVREKRGDAPEYCRNLEVAALKFLPKPYGTIRRGCIWLGRELRGGKENVRAGLLDGYTEGRMGSESKCITQLRITEI